jgi:hypothetical protein
MARGGRLLAADIVEQQALGRLAGHDGRPAVAAGQQFLGRGKREAPLLLAGAVATEAPPLENVRDALASVVRRRDARESKNRE